VYFLRLMADGRKLRARLGRLEAPAVFADAQEGESLLITSDYPRWMAYPSSESPANADESDKARFRPRGKTPDHDRVFG
jgi:hypothetical protein